MGPHGGRPSSELGLNELTGALQMKPTGVVRAAATALLLGCLCSCTYQPPETSGPAASRTPAAVAARDILGAAPGGIVQEGAGHLGARGAVGLGVTSVPAGDFSVTAACDGAEQATLTVSQQGAGTPDLTASFRCGVPFMQRVHLVPGSVNARVTLPEGSTASADATAAVRIAGR